MKHKRIDIQILLYFSSNDLPKLLKSIHSLETGESSVYFHFVDQSEDNKEYTKLLKQCKDFKRKPHISIELSKQKNYGFGKGHNEIYRKNKNLYRDSFIIINPDSILHPDLIINIEKYIHSLKDVRWGLLELLQFPSENPKVYDPITLETKWVSGAGMIINIPAFEEIGMFDENIFMYGEDVDISIRMRIEKYKILTLPNATFTHLTKDTDVSEESLFSKVHKQAAELYLRYKFGKESDIEEYIKLFGEKDPDLKEILSKYEKMKKKLKQRTYYQDFLSEQQTYSNLRWQL